MTKKEAKEYLRMLPEPYISEALDNIDNSPFTHYNNHHVYHKVAKAIDFFEWKDTPQGYSYWNNLFDRIQNTYGRFDLIIKR